MRRLERLGPRHFWKTVALIGGYTFKVWASEAFDWLASRSQPQLFDDMSHFLSRGLAAEKGLKRRSSAPLLVAWNRFGKRSPSDTFFLYRWCSYSPVSYWSVVLRVSKRFWKWYAFFNRNLNSSVGLFFFSSFFNFMADFVRLRKKDNHPKYLEWNLG